MATLRVKAPVASVDGARLQIEAGATDLYVGLAPASGDHIAFSARGSVSLQGQRTNVSDEDLARITQLAHERGVAVELAANMPAVGDDPGGGRAIKEQFLAYVERGLAAGVDGIIVGDLGNLIMLRERGVTVPVTASTLLATVNRFQIEMLAELGVAKVVLPQHFHLREIEALVRASHVKVVVFGHFGCSFYEAACGLLHGITERVNLGLPCRAEWEVGEKRASITDVAEDCSICVLDELMRIGVHAVKIVGRELDPRLTSTVTAAYVAAIRQYEAGASPEAVMAATAKRVPWWGQTLCSTQRCKYFLHNRYYT